MQLSTLDPYAISPYHLGLLKTYDVLDFADFPFLQVDYSQDGKYFLNVFIGNIGGFENRLLVEVTYAQIVQIKLGLKHVHSFFTESKRERVYYILLNEKGTIERAFDLPMKAFQAINPLSTDYRLELAGEYEDYSAITDYHAKYYAYELTRTRSADDADRLAAAMFDAQVELNPHQVDAALFAFQSPLSKGVILADEVGLGKTIEAGLVVAQKWAERKRKILIIVPANLRKQWSQEMMDKFFIPSLILEAKSFNQQIKNGNLNPFEQKDLLILSSYQFIKSKENYVKSIDWDIVIIDEAHRLRNVYKPQNKTANAIKDALLHVDKKILLTATPLQNSLLELYGLVSIIDDYAFGDLKSFRTQYTRTDEDHVNYTELKNRLAPVCKRTLRKQVLAYIPYTNRISITEEFFPSDDERKLYTLVSDYLQNDQLYALPSSQRQLMTLILRRLLASSTYAISGTLEALSEKLTTLLKTSADTSHATSQIDIEEKLADDFEHLDELQDEWEEDEDADDSSKATKVLTEDEKKGMEEELQALQSFLELSNSIKENSKGKKLLTALKRGFSELEKMKAPKKAIIFTESKRTQSYIKTILDHSDFAGKIVLFNGTNSDAESKAIYQQWFDKYKDTDKVSGSKSADMRAALVEYFRDEASIMIATEAAAEGVNLQFCSLVVNYDLPWNPQRIEQRIGRCHRYGQKFDVVVVNFLNKSNEADLRVYELLKNKFKLFDGVFGASDEVLGTVGSGVDFEKRIAEIYQNCRTQEAIQLAFDFLQNELEKEISEAVATARKSLLENFDDEVTEKLKVRQEQSGQILNKYENWLWELTRFYLKDYAVFDENDYYFNLLQNPFAGLAVHNGPYIIKSKLGAKEPSEKEEATNIYRINHPLAQSILQHVKEQPLPIIDVIFDYTNAGKKVSLVEELKYKSGWLLVSNASFHGFEQENRLVFTAVDEHGELIESEQATKLFSVKARKGYQPVTIPGGIELLLEEEKQEQLATLQTSIEGRNNEFFQLEVDKLHNWAEDKSKAAEKELKDVKERIKQLNREAKKTKNILEQLRIQKDLSHYTTLQNKLRQNIFNLEDEIQRQRDRMIGEIEKRMNLQVSTETLFTIRWIVL